MHADIMQENNLTYTK